MDDNKRRAFLIDYNEFAILYNDYIEHLYYKCTRFAPHKTEAMWETSNNIREKYGE